MMKGGDMAKEKIEGVNTIIGKGSVLEGSFNINSSIRVDGKIKGKLSVSNILTVGKEGVVEADVKAREAIVGGKIIGTLEASDRVVLESKSSLLGDLKTKLLVIEEGAIFKGNCDSGERTDKYAPEAEKETQKSRDKGNYQK